MVAVHPCERAEGLERVERPDIHARLAQRPPERCRRLADPTEPVVDEADDYTVARLRDQRIGKLAAAAVLTQDVALEVDVAACGADRIQPRRIVLGRVVEHTHGVALAASDTGRAGE